MSLRKLIRSAQVFVPFAQDARFAAQRLWQRCSGRPEEPDLLAVRRLGLGPDDLVLDIGANRGLVVEALLRLSGGARIVAFEPNPRLAAALARRHRGDRRVSCRALALGEAPGELTLWLPVYRGWSFDGLASLDPETARGWLDGERLYGFRPELLRLEPLRCEVAPLDALDLDPAFIKFDVQGHELAVLKGGERTLRRARPTLLIEDPAEDRETAFLARLDYVVAAFERGRFVAGRYGRLNSFFLPRERVPELLG